MEKDHKEDTIIEVLHILKAHRRPMLRFLGAAFLLSLVISLLLPNKYQAETTFYAASDDLSRPDVLFGISTERAYFYGGKNEQERFIAASNSGALIDSVLMRFDLYEHYDVKDDGPKSKHKVASEFRDHFDIIRNELEYLEVSFLDKDPQFAADVANGVRDILGNIISGLIQSSQYEMKASLENKIDLAQQVITETTDSIALLRKKYGLYDSENMIAQITEMLTKSKNDLNREEARLSTLKGMRGVKRDSINNITARIEGLKTQIQAIENPDTSQSSGLDIKLLNEVRPLIQALEAKYYVNRGELSRDEVMLSKLNVTFESRPPAMLLLQKAEPPIKKHSPKRSIIIIGSLMLAMICYVIGLLFYKGYQKTLKAMS